MVPEKNLRRELRDHTHRSVTEVVSALAVGSIVALKAPIGFDTLIVRDGLVGGHLLGQADPASRSPIGPCRFGPFIGESHVAAKLAARAVLECLKSEFETAYATYPKLRHVLIVTPNQEAFSEADMESAMLYGERRIQPLSRQPTETQIFIDDEGYSAGRKAYEAFRKLAMSTVRIRRAKAVRA